MADARWRVRRADARDVDEVTRVLHAAARRMLADGWPNWDPPYPRDRIAADIDEREVYVAADADGGAVAATFTLGPTAPRPYDPAPWRDPSAPALYLNRLAVDPAITGRGLGGWCLGEIARVGAERGVPWVRCDVLAPNERLRALYERHGYVARGERAHSGFVFVAYEAPVPARSARH